MLHYQAVEKYNRDQEVLKSMIFLSEQLGNMRDELDSIEAETIDSFMINASYIIL